MFLFLSNTLILKNSIIFQNKLTILNMLKKNLVLIFETQIPQDFQNFADVVHFSFEDIKAEKLEYFVGTFIN